MLDFLYNLCYNYSNPARMDQFFWLAKSRSSSWRSRFINRCSWRSIFHTLQSPKRKMGWRRRLDSRARHCYRLRPPMALSYCIVYLQPSRLPRNAPIHQKNQKNSLRPVSSGSLYHHRYICQLFLECDIISLW